jgi:MFS family permease
MTGWTTILGAGVAGMVPGLLLAGPIGGAIGATVGAVMGVVAERAGVRTVVALAVTTGTATGVFIGASIASVLCFPSTCLWIEIIAGFVTGIGALIGVGMIAALTARSFDEYQAAVAAKRPPPTTGCTPKGEDPEC